MEPGEIEIPAFKFEFKEGMPLNWRHILDQINITEVLSGINIDSLTAAHLNFAFADVVADPGYVATEDEEALKAITLMQLGVQYLLYAKQCNLDKKETIELKHREVVHHIQELKAIDSRQKQQLKDLKKRIHDIEMAQAMLVDVGQTKRPDLQNAIEKMMAEPPVRLEPAPQ